MADATYSPLVYMQQGGDIQVIASGGEIKVEAGGTITANGTQATAITAATGATYGTGVEAKINAIIVALEGVGVLAT